MCLYNLDRRLEDKETEVSQMYKRMTVLHSQNEAQASRLEEMETELAHVHQELDELQSQCEDKDAQVCYIFGQNSSSYVSSSFLRSLICLLIYLPQNQSLGITQGVLERIKHTFFCCASIHGCY